MVENTVEPISWDRRIVSDVHNGLEGRKNTLVQIRQSEHVQLCPCRLYGTYLGFSQPEFHS